MTDRLAEIFTRQAAYVESLRDVEERNDLYPGEYPLPLNFRSTQEHFRLLAWRITEEIVEAINVVDLSLQNIDALGSARIAFNDEIADALHFFIELCLASGVARAELLTGQVADGVSLLANDPADPTDSLGLFFRRCLGCMSYADRLQIREPAYHNPNWYDVIKALGLAMQFLKQRPWRTDDRPTERANWVLGLHLVFEKFCQCCLLSGIGSDALYQAYFAKAAINDERQRAYGV